MKRASVALLLATVLLVLPGCKCKKKGLRNVDGDRFDLVSASSAPIPGVTGWSRGRVVFTRPGCGDESDWRLRKKRARVRVEGLPKGTVVELTSSPGFPERVLLKANRAGRAKWSGRVPGSNPSVQSFSFAIRDMSGAVLASGSSRQLSRSTVRVQTKHEDAATGIGIDNRIEGSAATGRERSRTRFTGLEPGARVRLLARDPRASGGAPDTPVAEAVAGPRGTVVFVFDTGREGRALPFGARRLRDLWGVPLELDAGGTRLSLGPVPEHGLGGADEDG